MKVVVTGGSGFLGSHLCEALLDRGDTVWCLDNYCTGEPVNVLPLLARPGFRLVRTDVTGAFDVPGPVDAVAHLASPASPPDYARLPLQTLSAGSRGTENALRLAVRRGARFLLTSTSEVYGDPAVHPQPEGYWGNVNPVGPRSVYDEAKRYAEALTTAYRTGLGADTGIVRIFNTYGPRMRPHDGRVVSTFIRQALAGTPLTVYGDGSQTRSFCYVDDLVRGLLAMLDSSHAGPVNLGNPAECTVRDLAGLVLRLTGSPAPVEYRPLPVDDPVRRRPDIARARELLGWAPEVALENGVRRTVAWFARGPAGVPDPHGEPVEA
ncbi:NAD-dependent epimerase/dehydratase [Streptomyces lincolnensis]|uniref:NAD-dependent epimerase/dehydratase n=1 Tax=Streptomyces lincolnensis TaxID=1915 RepID=A0A1B1M275_STRLN|nr:UDP-glucuronic acid decarboxylase family protein [Streptomyces lincolnensis]ANS62779.1 NAD-dependent epimerase/dehydratase [Streptomyces lincolnensis]AXG51703.1 NAD-dependent epimerase/dehydratase [Streptomyces lincolnensis]QMV04720.1 NAD-dependent epimerase/dehydratase family protein [Streptomyces lincolnensis]